MNDERKELIETRARALAEDAVARQEAWTLRLGSPSAGVGNADACLPAVAAYRDRYKVNSDLPLGGAAKNDAQRADRERALAAIRAMRADGPSERATASPSIEVRAIPVP